MAVPITKGNTGSKAKTASKQRHVDQSETSRLTGAIFRALAVGLITLTALWLILAAVALGDADPMRLTTPFSIAALLSGALAAGITAGRCDRDEAPLAGFLAGAAYVLVLWLVSIFFRGSSDGISPLILAIGYAACLASAFVGGLIAKPRIIGSARNAPAAAARRRIKAKR